MALTECWTVGVSQEVWLTVAGCVFPFVQKEAKTQKCPSGRGCLLEIVAYCPASTPGERSGNEHE